MQFIFLPVAGALLFNTTWEKLSLPFGKDVTFLFVRGFVGLNPRTQQPYEVDLHSPIIVSRICGYRLLTRALPPRLLKNESFHITYEASLPFDFFYIFLTVMSKTTLI